MNPTIRPTALLAATMLAAVAGVQAPARAAAAAPYAGGEKVTIEGRVTDAGGKPLAGVTVALEASRAAWSLRKLGRARKEPTRISTVTDEAGGYTLVWPWHEYYNHFLLIVGLEVADRYGDRLREVERREITDRVLAGSPVAAPILVEDASFVRDHQAFVAGIDSAEKRKVFDDNGRPDRIDRVELAEHVEVTWWYFRRGKAYRFADGRLERVIPFDPVTSF